MRSTVILLAALGLAACSPQVPDSGAGFQDYNSYIKGHATDYAPTPAPAQAPAQALAAPAAGFSTAEVSAAIDAAQGKSPVAPGAPLAAPGVAAQAAASNPPAAPAAPAADGERPRGNAPAGIAETTSEMTKIAPGTVSDEQDFTAVTARETIESDKARIERNRAQYQVDQPTTLPQRTADGVPNIVAYALSSTNPVGAQMYKRGGIHFTSFAAACGKFASPDLAQIAFLQAGGPEKDRKGLDPDGDGFACAWDPKPFRLAKQ